MQVRQQRGAFTQILNLEVEAAVLCGNLKSGESLPSDRELQQLFQTGREWFAKPCRRFAKRGMIEVRKGAHEGTYIKQIEVAQGIEPSIDVPGIGENYKIILNYMFSKAANSLSVVTQHLSGITNPRSVGSC
ncbi:hypothetical protein CEDIAZO_00250 [Celerinatantimonas diazotrophica]|nr:hypothetical protein CEDIAZO_00250 [Celerinatantimonas diazotrophica]